MAAPDLSPWRSRSGKLYAISVAEETCNLAILLEAISSEGGVEDALVARVGCRALTSVFQRACLAQDGELSAAGCDRVAEGGGIALLVQALYLHASDEDVCVCATHALTALCAGRHRDAVMAAGGHRALLGCIEARQGAGLSGARGDPITRRALAALRSLAGAAESSPEWSRMILEWGAGLGAGGSGAGASRALPQWAAAAAGLTQGSLQPAPGASQAAPQLVSPVSPRRVDPLPAASAAAAAVVAASALPVLRSDGQQRQAPASAFSPPLYVSASPAQSPKHYPSALAADPPRSTPISPTPASAAAAAAAAATAAAPADLPPAYLAALTARPLAPHPPSTFLPNHAARTGLYLAISALDVPYVLLLMRSHAGDAELQASALDTLAAMAINLRASAAAAPASSPKGSPSSPRAPSYPRADFDEATAAPIGSCLALALAEHSGSAAGTRVEDAGCRALEAVGRMGTRGGGAVCEAAVLGGVLGVLSSMLESPRCHCDARAALLALRALLGLMDAAQNSAVGEAGLLKDFLLRGNVRAALGALNDLFRNKAVRELGEVSECAAQLLLRLCEASSEVYELCAALLDNGIVPALVRFIRHFGVCVEGDGEREREREGEGGEGSSAALSATFATASSAALALEALIGSGELGATGAAAAFYSSGGLPLLLGCLRQLLLPPLNPSTFLPIAVPHLQAQQASPRQPPLRQPPPPPQPYSHAPSMCRLLYALVFSEELCDDPMSAVPGSSASKSLGRHLCANKEGLVTLTSLMAAALGPRSTGRIEAALAGPLVSTCAGALASAAASAYILAATPADKPQPGAAAGISPEVLQAMALTCLSTLHSTLEECFRALTVQRSATPSDIRYPSAPTLGPFTLHACEALVVLLRNTLLCQPSGALPSALITQGATHCLYSVACYWADLEEAKQRLHEKAFAAAAQQQQQQQRSGSSSNHFTTIQPHESPIALHGQVVGLILSHSLTVLSLLAQACGDTPHLSRLLSVEELSGITRLAAARSTLPSLQSPVFTLFTTLALHSEGQRTALVRAGALNYALRTLDRCTEFSGQQGVALLGGGGSSSSSGGGGGGGGGGDSDGSGSAEMQLHMEKSCALLLKLFCTPLEGAPTPLSAPTSTAVEFQEPQASLLQAPLPQPALDFSPSVLALLSARPGLLLGHALVHYLACCRSAAAGAPPHAPPSICTVFSLIIQCLLQVVATVARTPWGDSTMELCSSTFPTCIRGALEDIAGDAALPLGTRDSEVIGWASAVEIIAATRSAAGYSACLDAMLQAHLARCLCVVLRGMCTEGLGAEEEASSRAAAPGRPLATPPSTACDAVEACLEALLALAMGDRRTAADLQDGSWTLSLGAALDGLGGKVRYLSQRLHRNLSERPAV